MQALEKTIVQFSTQSFKITHAVCLIYFGVDDHLQFIYIPEMANVVPNDVQQVDCVHGEVDSTTNQTLRIYSRIAIKLNATSTMIYCTRSEPKDGLQPTASITVATDRSGIHN